MIEDKHLPTSKFLRREEARARELAHVWNEKLNDVFTEITPYYSVASNLASFGMFSGWRSLLVGAVDINAGDCVLDVCAGPNAVGLGLLRRHSEVRMHALERNNGLLNVGATRARTLGLTINSVVGDAHHLPYEDGRFDAITMMWAGRHLRLIDAFSEVHRVLRPGGHFYYGDILRPRDKWLQWLFGRYLNACVSATALLFRCGPESRQCRDYFVQGMNLHYSAQEISDLLGEMGFEDVSTKTAPGGILGLHRAVRS